MKIVVYRLSDKFEKYDHNITIRYVRLRKETKIYYCQFQLFCHSFLKSMKINILTYNCHITINQCTVKCAMINKFKRCTSTSKSITFLQHIYYIQEQKFFCIPKEFETFIVEYLHDNFDKAFLNNEEAMARHSTPDTILHVFI